MWRVRIFGHPDAAAITALACTRSSTAARRRPASSAMTAAGSIPSGGWASSATPSPAARSSTACPARWQSACALLDHRRNRAAQRPAAVSELNAGGFAVGHNGNLTNGLTLRRQLVRDGAIMQSTTDTEVILHLLARSTHRRFIDRFIDALRQLEGSYSLAALTNKKLVGARDPLGIRPLVIGELDGCPIVTSETCALDIIGRATCAMSRTARSWCSPTRARSR